MNTTIRSPYSEALAWIEQHPATGSAVSLAKLVLSLWNSECSFSYRECVGNLDRERTALALRLIQHFTARGEDAELVSVGHAVCARYQRLWDEGQAMLAARNALERRQRAEADATDDE